MKKPARAAARQRHVADSKRGLQWRAVACAMGLLLTTQALMAAPATQRKPEPNTLVPKGVMRYAPSAFPDRMVASPGQEASSSFSVTWRTYACLLYTSRCV